VILWDGRDRSTSIRRSGIPGAVADVKPAEINWKVLAIAWVWGWSTGSLVCIPVRLLPQQTACRCPWEGEHRLSELSLLLGYQCSSSISERSLPEKRSQLYTFGVLFPHWLYGNTVPFFSGRSSWCLPFLHIPSPPSIAGGGCLDALGQNWFVSGKQKNRNTLLCKLEVCCPWRSWTLFSCGCLGGRVSAWSRARGCHRGETGPWLPAAPCPCRRGGYSEYFS